jgi:hypothetical protein
LSKTIPEELKLLAKADVNFFLEKIPTILKPSLNQNGSQSTFTAFLKLFSLYTDGILSRPDFFELMNDLRNPDHTSASEEIMM